MSNEAKANEAKANEAKANEAKANEAKTAGQVPVNTRVLEKDEGPEEDESVFSAEAMQKMLDDNKRLMSSGTQEKFDALITHIGKASDLDLVFEPVDDYQLQLMIMPGSARGESGDYVNSEYLPGNVYIKSTSNAKVKVKMPVTQAVALAYYLPKFLKQYSVYIDYFAALERDINLRRADLDVFNLGK